MTNPHDLAAPTIDRTAEYDSAIHYLSVGGLTKREYFAAMAMQGLCAQHVVGADTPAWVTGEAVAIADALIAELNKPASL